MFKKHAQIKVLFPLYLKSKTILTVNHWWSDTVISRSDCSLHTLVLYCHNLLFTHINYLIKVRTFLQIIEFLNFVKVKHIYTKSFYVKNSRPILLHIKIHLILHGLASLFYVWSKSFHKKSKFCIELVFPLSHYLETAKLVSRSHEVHVLPWIFFFFFLHFRIDVKVKNTGIKL